MEGKVDLHLHHGGSWVGAPELNYVGGDVFILDNFDVDYLTIITVKDVYRQELGYINVKQVYVLQPGKDMNKKGLFLVQDDRDIRRLLSLINKETSVLKFFATHEIDEAVLVEDILPIACDHPQPAMDESMHDAEANSEENSNDNNSEYDVCEDDNDVATDDVDDVDDVPIERPIFSLGMRFSSAVEARESIIRYGISMRVTLKYLKNEPTRMRVKCVEDGCPFLLFVSKGSSNPSLTIKALVEEHNHPFQRILPSKACTARFLAKHFKNKILQTPKYKVKDLKKDAEDELRVKISYSKCKIAKKLVLKGKLKARVDLEEGREVNEPRQRHGTKLSRKRRLITCSACKLKGHNKASCLKVSL